MELGRLTAVFDADTRKFQAGAKTVESKVSDLSKVIKTLGSTSVALQGPLGGVAGRLGGLSSLIGQANSAFQGLESSATNAGGAMAGMAGPIGIFIAAAVAEIAVIGLLAKSLFDLASSTAEFQGKLYDLSQQTGVSVETLSALDTMAAQTGSDIGAIVASLGIFQKNLEASLDPASKLSGIMGELGVETTDTEEALRQTLKSLAAMKEGSHQTALALAVFGRGGKAFLAILKEMHGDLDGTIARLEEMGLITNTHAAKAADEFNDSLVLLDRQMRALGATIGVEVMPAILAAVNDLSAALKENKEAIHAIGVAAGFIANVFANTLRGALGAVEIALWNAMPGFMAIAGVLERISDAISTLGPVSGGAKGQISVAGGIGNAPTASAGVSVGGGILRRKGSGGGGGRGGGGSARQDPGVQLLEELKKQLSDLIPKTQLQTVQEQLLGKEFDKTSDAVKRRIQMTAADMDLQKMVLGITRERIVGLKAEREEMEKMVALVREAGDQGLPFFSRRRTMNDLTGQLGTDATRPRSVADGATRPRIATAEAAVMRERMAMMHEQMMGLGQDLTSIFSQSIGDGFEQGAKRGLQSLALGLLDIVQNIFLNKMAEGLGGMLSSLAGGSGTSKGGGWLSRIAGWITGAVGGGIGGGAAVGGAGSAMGGAFAGLKFAKGGMVPGDYKGYDSVPMMLTPGETVIPRGGSMGKQVVNNFTIQMPPVPRGGYASPQSKRQMAEHLVAAIHGAQT